MWNKDKQKMSIFRKQRAMQHQLANCREAQD